jgi:hypothetical protein
MPTDIKDLLAAARAKPMTQADIETQRRSFAYGNAHIENARVTREMVAEAAQTIKSRK